MKQALKQQPVVIVGGMFRVLHKDRWIVGIPICNMVAYVNQDLVKLLMACLNSRPLSTRHLKS